MLSRQDNELLCRVGPETPMGQMMRRYWLPVAMSTELVVGTPRRVRLLGENFVAFRGDDGTVGVLDELCPHRGASLVLARTEGCALRCLYHGWKVDRTGTVVETPSEPEGSTFAGKVHLPPTPCTKPPASCGRISGRPRCNRRRRTSPSRTCPIAGA